MNTLLVKQLRALIQDESNVIANLSNVSALLNAHFDQINWVGFYLWDDQDQELVLGPFQGKVACNRIPMGAVCVEVPSNNNKHSLFPMSMLSPVTLRATVPVVLKLSFLLLSMAIPLASLISMRP